MTRMARMRHGAFMRAVSAFVALSFALSFTGIGYAAPTGTPESTESVVETTPVDVGAEATDPGSGEPEPDPSPSVEVAPTTTEPDPLEVVGDPGESGVGDPGIATDEVAPAATKMVAAAAPVGGSGGSVQLQLEGYRTSPSTNWVTGDLGKLYREGDWVPYRLIINNSGGDAAYTMPAFALEYDHYNSNQNAIGVDRTRYWNVTYTAVAPVTGDPNVYSGTAITPSSQDVPSPSGTFGSSPFLKTTFPSGTVVVPAGQYAVVYFQAHLSLSAYWLAQNPPRGGSGYYSGSSMQMRLASDAGDKTVPIPVPPRPGGGIAGVKFHDVNRNGVRDAGEVGLGGWVFHLTGGPEGFPLDITVTSAADGTFAFPILPAATYTLTEELLPGWEHSTPQPLTVVVAEDVTTNVAVGNYRLNVEKTWELDIGSIPVGSSAFVRYLLDGEEHSIDLTGTAPYTASMSVPYGSVISNVRWYVSWHDVDVLLGTTAGETMDEAYENHLDYAADVSGAKFDDLDGDRTWDTAEPGLGGWTIVLLRQLGSEFVEYARTTTAADGSYSFSSVIPGEYRVIEEQQSGWIDMLAPLGSFTVANGSHITGRNFGNLLVDSAISIEKSGPLAAHVGDVLPYTIVVRNTGNYMLYDVMLTDPVLGLIRDLGDMAVGAEITVNASHTVTASDPDPLVNVATVNAATVFGGSISDSDDHSTDIIKPAISVTKTANHAIAVGPADITYEYVVTNTGEDPLYDVTLVDNRLTVPGGAIGTLLPQQSATLTANATLNATTENTATASGTDELDLTVTDTDHVRVEVYHPSIAIQKSAVPSVIIPGEQVLYTYLVTNTGDTPLHNIDVSDDHLGFIGHIDFLGAGLSTPLSLIAPVFVDTTNIAFVVGYYGTIETEFYGPVEAYSSAEVDVTHPQVHIEKTASTPAVLPGGSVTYDYVVTNVGDVTLQDLLVTDDHLGVIGTIPLLAVGQSMTLHATTTLSASTLNIGAVAGTDLLGHPVSDTDDASVAVYHPSIQIEKTADPVMIHAGETVIYTYFVTNTGDIDLTDVHVTDDVLGAIGVIPSLPVGASETLWVDHAVSVDTLNVGEAVGEYGIADSPFGGTVSDTDDAVVDVIAPAITVDKTAVPADAVAGTPITYHFVVTNTGDVTVYDIHVHDDVLGDIGTISELAPDASTELTAVHALSATTTNVVTATGHDELEREVEDTDSLTVPIYHPAIAIDKTVTPATAGVGDPVTYTFDVRNIGDIMLTDIEVSDDVLGIIGYIDELAPGAHSVLTMAVSAPADDVTNIGTASGDYTLPLSGGTGTVDSNDDADLDVVHPAIRVTKSASPTRIVGGETVDYTYAVENIGDVPLFDVSLMDDRLGEVGVAAELAVGQTLYFSSSAELDVTTVNVVTATAHDALDHEVSDSDTARVEVFHPAVSIDKTADPTVVLSGETVTYTYVITNTGDAMLHDLVVTDDVIGAIGGADTLAPDASVTMTSAAPVAVDTVNVGTVVAHYGDIVPGEDAFHGTVTDSDEATVDVVAPEIDVTKSVTPTEILVGESVTYTFTVTNTGDVDLFGVTVTDDKLGPIATLPTLLVDETQTYTRTVSLTLPTENVVVARGTDAVGHAVDDSATAFVDVAPPFTPPDVTIDKSADKTSASAGDLVTYTLTYRNIGASPAYDMTIVDDFDERYVTIESAGGGTVSGGKITWTDAGPLYAEDAPRTITYKVRIDTDLPLDVKHIDNVVVIHEPTEVVTDNNSDNWRVSVGEPFLPFTGFEGGLLALIALLATGAGFALRRFGRLPS